MRKWILFGFIIFIAAFLRLWQLGNVPYGFLNDEVVAIYNAQSIWQIGGHIIDGEFLPLNIHGVGNDLTPVPVYIESVFLGLFGTSPFVGRLAYALAGIGSVVLLFFILDYLTHNDWISLGGAFAFAVSPWHLLVSRGAWEGVVAIFFYLLGILIFLKMLKKGSILWSLPAFLLAFYSYNAGKIFFVFFITGILFWYRKILLQRRKELVTFIICVILFIVSFLLVLKTSQITRSDVLIWENTKFAQQVSDNVKLQRAESTAPNILKTLYSNKEIEIFRKISDTYLNFFSPYYLFLRGDADMINGQGIFSWGQMYFIELPLFLLGIFFILKKENRQKVIVLFIGLVSAPFATALTVSNFDYNYFFRSNIAIPFLAAIVGCGMYFLWESIREKPRIIKFTTITVFAIFYGFFISRFLYTYFFQLNTYDSEAWLASTRNTVNLISLEKSMGKHVFVGTTDKEFLLQYAFFTKDIQVSKVQEVWRENNKFVLNGITFGDVCQLLREGNLPSNGAFVVPASCDAKVSFQKQIANPANGNLIWKVYEN